ncbi:MAG: hypothetical protein ACUVX8_01775 [Candidatus Zipacnadales bacterium]
MAGQLYPKFSPNLACLHIRNGVGIASPHHVVFTLGEDPVNFYEFASLFRDELHCPNALYLEGTIFNRYFLTLNRNGSHMLLGPILGATEVN